MTNLTSQYSDFTITASLFAIVIFAVLLLIFWLMFDEKKEKKYNKEIKEDLLNIIDNHIAKSWDIVSNMDDYHHKLFQEHKFKKHEEHDYFEFLEEASNLKSYRFDWRGFTIKYKSEDDSYYLSLHLGTSTDFLIEIHESLSLAFRDVKRSDGNFIKGFVFKPLLDKTDNH